MIKVIKGDITELRLDAIVNAANNHFWMKAGVAGAIKRKGGASIEEEAVSKGPVSVGEAVVTGAGSLKAGYVIHAATMGQDLVTDMDKVRAATRNALLRAGEMSLTSIAFPALGTGIGGLDLDRAAKVMVSEARRCLARGTSLEEVVFALFDDAGYEAFARVAGRDNIVCLGDSITYGFPYGPEMSWVGRGAKKLGVKMINKGINGDTTRQMLRRFERDVSASAPAYVIIMGGTNDAFIGVTPEEIQDNVVDMAAKAFDDGICPVIGLPAPVNLYNPDGFVPDFVAIAAFELDSCRELIKEFAGGELLPVLDFYTPLLDPETGRTNPDYFADEGHPNETGYGVLTRAVLEMLPELKKGLLKPNK